MFSTKVLWPWIRKRTKKHNSIHRLFVLWSNNILYQISKNSIHSFFHSHCVTNKVMKTIGKLLIFSLIIFKAHVSKEIRLSNIISPTLRFGFRAFSSTTSLVAQAHVSLPPQPGHLAPLTTHSTTFSVPHLLAVPSLSHLTLLTIIMVLEASLTLFSLRQSIKMHNRYSKPVTAVQTIIFTILDSIATSIIMDNFH